MSNAIAVVMEDRRATKAFDASATIGDVFTFASLHLVNARQFPERADYDASVHGQRVDFSALLCDLWCTEVVFTVKAARSVDTKAPLKAAATAAVQRRITPRYGEVIRARAWHRVLNALDVDPSQQHQQHHDPMTAQPARKQPGLPPADGAMTSSSAALDVTSCLTEVSYPIVVGSVVQWLSTTSNNAETHSWTVYVRGHKNEDLSEIIEAVEFKLHDTFKDPVRRVETPPFEVSERGWGQFTIGLTILLRHVEGPGKHVATSHFIAFSPCPTALTVQRPAANHCVPPLGKPYVKQLEGIPPFALVKPPCVTERADELVVRNPTAAVTEAFSRAHAALASSRVGAAAGGTPHCLTVWPDIKGHLALPAGQTWLQRQGAEAEAEEFAELCSIRNALAAEVAVTWASKLGAPGATPQPIVIAPRPAFGGAVARRS